MGYNVRVVHFDSLFPRPYYWVGKLFIDYIQAKTGTVAYTKTPREPQQYIVDGVPVLFVPLKKLLPHKAPSKRQIIKAFCHVIDELEREDFTPDVVTAHFVLPQLQFLPLFKEKFHNARTCLVLHGNSGLLPYFYPHHYKDLMSFVDVWGFRSLAFQLDFEKHFGKRENMFLCYSGIPDNYLESINKAFVKGVKRFAYVGSLYELKNVDITLRALNKSMVDKDYIFDIVGSGAENGKLHHLVEELGMRENVVFHGQKKREEAQEILRNADCFIMVSTREAFGLVYVEAMAKGCIVVATKGQGIDGIITHSENGFLCKARDVDGLAEIISHIVCLNQTELQQISKRAVATATELTDRKVAKHYIDSILQ